MSMIRERGPLMSGLGRGFITEDTMTHEDVPNPWYPDVRDFLEAMGRIRPYVHETPLLRAEHLDCSGHRVYLKPENLQRTGSFKVRGGFNAMQVLSSEERERGIITYSSGNFAQALALAAREVGETERGEPYPCTVVMPEHAKPMKVERTRAIGAEILFAGTTTRDRELRAKEIAAERGLSVIPSYDDPHIIAGQGTIGIEILEQWKRLSQRSEQLALVAGPVGGGGLFSGTAAALRTQGYAGDLTGVEPEAADDTYQSMNAGKRITIPAPQTVCDGLMSIVPGAITFPVLQKSEVRMVTVTEKEIKAASYWLLDQMKLLVEPSGAVTVAAWKSGRLEPTSAGDTVLILSGGNTDPALIAGWGG